jgi:hypothetical protein
MTLPCVLLNTLLTGITRPNKRWKHEDASEMMFDYLIADNGIQMPEEDTNFIKALISGDVNRWRE